jgi:tRNA(Ile)-lysidine synthase
LAETGGEPTLTLPPRRGGSLPLATGEGTISIDRAVGARVLAAAMVCAGGGQRTPRGDQVEAIRARLAAGRDFDAALTGARLTARRETVVLFRNAGEYGRRPMAPLALTPGVASVWDGRFEITSLERGSVVPAQGRLAALPRADRDRLKSLHPGARGGLPVLIRDDGSDPVLAWGRAEVRCLVGPRLAQALDQTPHETDLEPAPNGATPGNALSSFPNIH